MKFKKAVLKDSEEIEKKDIVAKDIAMMRITLEFPVLKNNITTDMVDTYLDCARSDIVFPENKHKFPAWIKIESSDVTINDIKAFTKDNPDWYLYDPLSDDDIDLMTVKK